MEKLLPFYLILAVASSRMWCIYKRTRSLLSCLVENVENNPHSSYMCCRLGEIQSFQKICTTKQSLAKKSSVLYLAKGSSLQDHRIFSLHKNQTFRNTRLYSSILQADLCRRFTRKTQKNILKVVFFTLNNQM